MIAAEAEEIVAELVGQGWTYETEEPMDERESEWWAARPELCEAATPVGEKGRLPLGESWQRAMDLVNERLAQGSKRRYRIRGRRIEKDWWAYQAVRISTWEPKVKKESPPMSHARIAELSRDLPRCAQRARAIHGGDSKVAYRNEKLAFEVAEFVKGRAYRCQLPAPAIGEHWHIATKKQRKWRI